MGLLTQRGHISPKTFCW